VINRKTKPSHKKEEEKKSTPSRKEQEEILREIKKII